MLFGENTHPDCCPDCGQKLELQVLQSAAGYYIGTICDCGPFSRESGYFHTRREAENTLDEWYADEDEYGVPTHCRR